MSSSLSYPSWSVEITLRVTRIMQPNTDTLILAKKKKSVQTLNPVAGAKYYPLTCIQALWLKTK